MLLGGGALNKFLMHPSDLAKRRKSCAQPREQLLSIERQCVTRCNLCGSPKNVIIAERDRYGLPIRTALCAECGLVYLVDRFGAAAYGRFYRDGMYRAISSSFLGTRHSISQIEANQADYAARLANTLAGYIQPRDGASLVDIGGSAGMVALEFKRRFGLHATVLDPSEEEAAAARRAGLESVTGSVEDWTTDEKFDVVLLCRSVEHFFDLRTALAKIRGLLAPGGVFYCDIADFMELCRLSGPPETIAKIDHCYWLSHETAPEIFAAAGFEVITTNLVFGTGQIGFLMQASDPVPVSPRTSGWVAERIAGLLAIESAWKQYGDTYPDWTDWLHRKAYRAKRKLLSSLRNVKAPAAPQERAASTPRT
jgi:SAM-dependent methyltransferase